MFRITLKAARVHAGLRQEPAAELIGITAKTLRNYEQGKTAIPGHVLRKASEIYNIPEERIEIPVVNDGDYDEKEEDFFLMISTV